MSKQIDQKKCCHKRQSVFSISAVESKNGGTKCIVCKTCEKRWDVPLTAEEKRLWLERMKQETQQMRDMNTLYGAFQEAFYQYNQGEHDGWKYSGNELMERVEKFAKKHPEVMILSCDDSGNTGSMIVLIPHRTMSIYWGTTMVIIPQIFGEPLEMFLYPGHALGMEKALHVLNREARQKSKIKKLYWPKP